LLLMLISERAALATLYKSPSPGFA